VQIIIFKIISDRYRRAHIKESLAAVWNLKRDNKVTNYGDNVFRAQFPIELDVDKILKNKPWRFEGDLVAMERCMPRTLKKSYKFEFCEF